MAYVELTPLQKNSLPTKTTSLLAAGGSSVEVEDQSVFYRGGALLTKGWSLGPDDAVESYTEEITVSATDDVTGAGTVTISARAIKADGTNGAAREWPIGTVIKNTYTTGTHDQVIDNFKAAVGSWAAFDPSPVWSVVTPTITTTVARAVRNGNVVTFAASFVISDGLGAVLDSLALPVAASQIANYQVSLSSFKDIETGGNHIMSDPFAYVDFNDATPKIKFHKFGTLGTPPATYTAVLNIAGSYEV